MKRHFAPLLFAFWACILLGAQSGSAQTYTYDGRTLHRWQGDPRTLNVSEWQVWLYKRGQATGAANHWGTISETSAAKAIATLKSNQDFEQRYCKFFGRPPDCEQNMTYSNPLGPIAILKTTNTLSQRIVTDLSSIKEAKDGLDKLMDLSTRLQTAYNPYSYHGLGTTPNNPFEGVGTFVMDYGASLKAALDKVKLAAEQLNALNNTNERELESSLNEFDAVAKDQIDRVSALEADSAEVQVRYANLLKEGVLSPATATETGNGGETWMHVAFDNLPGAGDDNKKMRVDVEPGSNGLSVREVDFRSDSTVTMEWQMPFANIQSAYKTSSTYSGVRIYSVLVQGTGPSDFNITMTTQNESGNVETEPRTGGSYTFFFKDEKSAAACVDFINNRRQQRN